MDGKEDIEPMSTNINMAEEEPVPIVKSSIDPQPNP